MTSPFNQRTWGQSTWVCQDEGAHSMTLPYPRNGGSPGQPRPMKLDPQGLRILRESYPLISVAPQLISPSTKGFGLRSRSRYGPEGSYCIGLFRRNLPFVIGLRPCPPKLNKRILFLKPCSSQFCLPSYTFRLYGSGCHRFLAEIADPTVELCPSGGCGSAKAFDLTNTLQLKGPEVVTLLAFWGLSPT